MISEVREDEPVVAEELRVEAIELGLSWKNPSTVRRRLDAVLCASGGLVRDPSREECELDRGIGEVHL
jgi:hypothetical protein